MVEPMSAPKTEASGRRYGAGALVLLGLALLAGSALSVPFLYETQTLWYKTGAARVMLRAGQMAGLLALVLLMVQILLALRLHLLEQVFGRGRLLRWHRRGGLLLVGAASAHVLLVQAPEGFTNLSIGFKYWPEMVGGLLFSLLALTVFLAWFRQRLRLDFRRWRRLHLVLGYLLPAVALVHVRFVSESFAAGLPSIALLLLFAALAVTAAAAVRGRTVRPQSGRNPSGHQKAKERP